MRATGCALAPPPKANRGRVSRAAPVRSKERGSTGTIRCGCLDESAPACESCALAPQAVLSFAVGSVLHLHCLLLCGQLRSEAPPCSSGISAFQSSGLCTRYGGSAGRAAACSSVTTSWVRKPRRVGTRSRDWAFCGHSSTPCALSCPPCFAEILAWCCRPPAS